MTRYYGKQKKNSNNNNWKLRNCKIVNPLNMFFIKLKTAVRYSFFNTNFLLKEPYQCLREVSCASVEAILKHKCLTDLFGELVNLSIFPYNVSLLKKRWPIFNFQRRFCHRKLAEMVFVWMVLPSLFFLKCKRLTDLFGKKDIFLLELFFIIFSLTQKKKRQSVYSKSPIF